MCVSRVMHNAENIPKTLPLFFLVMCIGIKNYQTKMSQTGLY